MGCKKMAERAKVYDISNSPLYKESNKRLSALQSYVSRSSITLGNFYSAGLEAVDDDLAQLNDSKGRDKFAKAVYKAAKDRFEKIHKGKVEGEFNERDAFHYMTGIVPEQLMRQLETAKDGFTTEYFEANIRDDYLKAQNDRHLGYTVENVNADNVGKVLDYVAGGDKAVKKDPATVKNVLLSQIRNKKSIDSTLAA